VDYRKYIFLTGIFPVSGGGCVEKETRYDTSGLLEDQYQPGSRRRVLRNLLGVKSKRQMDALEGQELLRALKELAGLYSEDHRFTAADICRMHEIWLGGIYPWAGKYRQVNISKGSFPFAAAAQIPRLMDDFEKNILRRYTPCRSKLRQDTAYDLAVVHTELILIHPFREGNGRAARLLSSLMALQAGLPPLDFGHLKGKKREGYFAAVHSGVDRNYDPMVRIFSEAISRALRISGQSASSSGKGRG